MKDILRLILLISFFLQKVLDHSHETIFQDFSKKIGITIFKFNFKKVIYLLQMYQNNIVLTENHVHHFRILTVHLLFSPLQFYIEKVMEILLFTYLFA
jgi:hypothetical protein